MAGVQQQRCGWHIWRNLGGELASAASQAAEGLTGEMAEQARKQARTALGELIHKIMDAKSYEQAETALATLQGHPLGAPLAKSCSTSSWIGCSCLCWTTTAACSE